MRPQELKKGQKATPDKVARNYAKNGLKMDQKSNKDVQKIK